MNFSSPFRATIGTKKFVSKWFLHAAASNAQAVQFHAIEVASCCERRVTERCERDVKVQASNSFAPPPKATRMAAL
jgi:hypothetical protein